MRAVRCAERASSSVVRLAPPSSPILVGAQREFCRTGPNQTEVTAKGLHVIQEDSADAIGHAVAGWLSTLS